jgi:hypothetical protein
MVNRLTEDVAAGAEKPLALLRVQPVDEFSRVVLVGLLVAEDETSLHAFGHFAGHVGQVPLQIFDSDFLLVDVRRIGATGQT